MTCDGTEISRHRRCLAGQSLLVPEHARILRAMRAEQAIAAPIDTVVEERDLTVDDRIGGVA